MTLFSGNWRRRLLVGGALYLLYALVALAFLTGVAGKRVVAAPVFSPYAAAPPPAAVQTRLAQALVPPPVPAAQTPQAPQTPRRAALRLPDLEMMTPYDIHTVGSAAGGGFEWKAGGPYAATGLDRSGLAGSTALDLSGSKIRRMSVKFDTFQMPAALYDQIRAELLAAGVVDQAP